MNFCFTNETCIYINSETKDSYIPFYNDLFVDDNKMFFTDLKNNKHLVRPIIKLNSDIVVTSGTGMETDPLIVGEA